MGDNKPNILQILESAIKNNSFTILPVNTLDNLDEDSLMDAFEAEPEKEAIDKLNLNKFKFKTDDYTILFSENGILVENNSNGEILETDYDLDLVYPIIVDIINNKDSILLKKNENNLCIADMMFKYVKDSKGLCDKFQQRLNNSDKKIDINLLFRYACSGGNVKLVKFLLLNYKDDIIDHNNNDKSIMYYALLSGNSEVIRTLIQSGFKINNESLEGACASGKPELVWFLLDNYLTDFNLENNKDEIIKLFEVINNPEIANIFLFKRGILDINSVDINGCNILHYTAKGGHFGMMEFLVETSIIDLNRIDNNGKTILHYAAEGGNVEVLKFLLLQPLTIGLNSVDNNGKTVLHYAIDSGNSDMLHFLLQQPGINLNVLNLFEVAIEKGNPEIVRTFFRNFPNININEVIISPNGNQRTLLEIAVEKGNIGIIKTLLEHPNIDVNIITYDNIGGQKTPLEVAIEKKNIEILKILLAHEGIDINVQNDNGQTPLYCAVENGDQEAVKLLLSQEGIDVNAKNEYDGNTPLHMAAENKDQEIIELLLTHDVIDVNVQNKDGDTPFHLAARDGSPEVIKLLLSQKGIDVNAKNFSNNNLLHCAAENENPEVIKLLLAHEGIDVNAKNGLNTTPLHLAAKNENPEVIKLLLAQEGIDVNAKDFLGEIPLHYAARSGNRGVVELLLTKEGIDVNAKNFRNDTPLHLAARNKNPEVIKTLLSDKRLKIEDDVLMQQLQDMAEEYPEIKDSLDIYNSKNQKELLSSNIANATDLFDNKIASDESQTLSSAENAITEDILNQRSEENSRTMGGK